MTSKKVDVDALEETMEEVVETLDLAEQAANHAQARNPDPIDRARAAAIQKQAEAMLDAAAESGGGAGGERKAPFMPNPPRSGGLVN
ncbi:hypothetical protein [Azospirillum rugosum]|uniref:Uncharacterized protein YaaN involved in tellurite resistance n=1 Tax=Azospirillum rugosum TaxID=416170 RepID=A0ABS4SHP4_9PROT|nr:hypothetical protein [Azospirillum rugosum]MBP2292017.1 uncharacterized protein YaaN involved in tellurite resistance [Azospirillum rugosum]MDQ0525847.1 uncharacterized protein YaaN involved in tellurite resistance [Azospirillum rugosum]